MFFLPNLLMIIYNSIILSRFHAVVGNTAVSVNSVRIKNINYLLFTEFDKGNVKQVQVSVI